MFLLVSVVVVVWGAVRRPDRPRQSWSPSTYSAFLRSRCTARSTPTRVICARVAAAASCVLSSSGGRPHRGGFCPHLSVGAGPGGRPHRPPLCDPAVLTSRNQASSRTSPRNRRPARPRCTRRSTTRCAPSTRRRPRSTRGGAHAHRGVGHGGDAVRRASASVSTSRSRKDLARAYSGRLQRADVLDDAAPTGSTRWWRCGTAPSPAASASGWRWPGARRGAGGVLVLGADVTVDAHTEARIAARLHE